MVYQIRKVRGKELFSVKNKETGKIHSHETTKADAKKQVKLLQAIDHGFIPSGNSEDLEGGCFGLSCFGRTNQVVPSTGSRRITQVGIEPTTNQVNPVANIKISKSSQDNKKRKVVPQTIEEQLYGAYDTGPNRIGYGRMNSTVKTMITYLQSLYPHKTLISVANEILKLTGHSMTGKGRKSIKASEIAKYVIGAIGSALAIAVAIFLLNNEIEKGRETDYQNAQIRMENERQRRIKIEAENKKKSDLQGGCFGLSCFRNRRRVAPIMGYPQLITTVINYVDRHPGQFNRIVYNWEHNNQTLIDDINERARVIMTRRRNPNPNFLTQMYLPTFVGEINNSQNLQNIPIGQEDLYNYRGQRRPITRHGTQIGSSSGSSSSSSSSSSGSSNESRPPSPTGSGRKKRRLRKKKV